MDLSADTDVVTWENALKAMQVRIWKATQIATQQGMYLVERNVKFYLRTFTHPEGTPTPSPRGGPPAMVTGNLIRSWRNEPLAHGRKPWTVVAAGGPTAVYARIQELGGMTGRGHMTFIPKRPYVRPMARVSRRGVRRIYVAYWSNAIRG